MAVRFAWAILLTAAVGHISIVLEARQAAKPEAQDASKPVEVKPFVSVEAGGPTAQVTGMAFSPDGRRLYVAGYDKVVHVYQRNSDGEFELEPTAALRVPIGPGVIGSLFDLAISPDGKWLAAGGRGLARGEAGFRDNGWIWPSAAMKETQRADQGVIFVWNTETRAVRQLRGHHGFIVGLAFAANPPQGTIPRFVSAAAEGDDRSRGAVYVWDVDKGTHEAYPRPLVANEYRPGLVAWHKPDQGLLVGISWWQDGVLRLWEAGSNQTWDGSLGKNNQALAYAPDSDLILSGDFDERGKGSGRIRAWRVAQEPNLQATEVPGHSFPPRQIAGGGQFSAPQIMSLFPSRAGGPADTAAIAMRLRRQGQAKGAYELVLLDVAPGNLPNETAERARVPLWDNDDIQPYLAVSANGQYLAISGASDKNARVINLRDVLASKAKEPQVVRGAGVPLSEATFVRHRQDQRRGLLVARSGAPARRLVFDFNQRIIAEYQPNEWGEDSAGTGQDLSGELQQARSRVHLSDRQTFQTAALMPAGPPLQEPLLALAYDERGEPALRLYKAATGEALRQFTGHLGTIRHLAFDRSGRFLVSVADDQTICVWSLADLQEVIGKHGLVTGVTVSSNDQGKLFISSLDERAMDRANRGKLAKEDVIDRLVVHNRPYPLTTNPDSFYAAIWPAAPGEEVALAVRGKGEVRLRVGQAIDERKPLFSLFLIRSDVKWLWIGWSPMGPYDAGSRDAEKYLGWHFNLLQEDRPTSFAPADQYRDQYARTGLLQALLEKGNLADALSSLPAPVLPPLRLTVLVTEDKAKQVRAPDAEDQVIVTDPQVTLTIRPSGPKLESLRDFSVQINDQTLKLDPQKANDWERKLTLSKRFNQIRVQVQTFEEKPQIVSRNVALRYVPPAPEIAAFAIAQRQRDDPTCQVTATVRMRTPGERQPQPPAGIRLLHNGNPVKNLALEKTADAWQIKHKIEKLEEGVNWITLQAVNDGAITERVEEPYLTRESAAPRTEEIIYTKKKVAPPNVIALRLQSVGPDDKATKWSLSQAQQTGVRVTEGRVRLRGEITADTKLTEAQLAGRGELRGFQNREKEKSFSIDEELQLAPGRQKLELVTRCADSEEPTKLTLSIEFQPPLPRLTLVTPERDEQVIAGAENAAALRLLAELAWGADAQPCAAEVLLNGQSLTTLKVAANQAKLQFDLPPQQLQPKRNRLQVRLRNEWNAQSDGEERTINFLRPPRDLKLKPAAPGEKPFLTVEATVKSAADLPLQPENVKATINGRAHLVNKIVVTKNAAISDANWDEWRIELQDLPLESGKNNLTLNVYNGEGETRPITAEFQYNPPKPPDRAVIAWLEPANTQVTRPQVEIRWQVESKTPLGKTTVLVNEQPLGDKIDRKQDGNVTVMWQTVSLQAGPNRIGVLVENAGGLARLDRELYYIPIPVELKLRDIKGAAKLPDGRWFAAEKSVTLIGDIVWDRPPAPEERAKRRQELEKFDLNVYANGFLQTRTVVTASRDSSDTRLTFTAPLLLTEKAGNHIELRANTALAADQTTLEIDCGKPDDQIRLHVLVVSDRPDDEATKPELEAHVRNVFEKRGKIFKVVRVKPLLGYISDENIHDELEQIQEQMASDMTGGSFGHNELLVVYYQGHELHNKQKGVCWTTDRFLKTGRHSAHLLTCSNLVGSLRKSCPGARVVLLDVVKDSDFSDPQAWERSDFSWSDAVAVLRLLGDPQAVPAPGRLLDEWDEKAQQAHRLKELTELLDRALQKAGPITLWTRLAPQLRFLPIASAK